MFFKEVVQAVLLFWVIDMGDDPPHGPGPGGVSTQVIQTYHWEATKAAGGWYFGIIAAEYGDAGGRV